MIKESFSACRFAFTILKRFMPEEKLADVKGATLTTDGTGVVFDVPAADVEDYIQGIMEPSLVREIIIDWYKHENILLLCPWNPFSCYAIQTRQLKCPIIF